MSRKDELLALAKRVEALSGPDRQVDAAVSCVINDFAAGEPALARFYTASLDAAISLVPEGWQSDGLKWWEGEPSLCSLVESEPDCGRWTRFSWNYSVEARAATPALALTAAALRALAAIRAKIEGETR